MDLKDFALCLKIVPFEEKHLILSALTAEHGNISVIAYGGRTGKLSGLDYFIINQWVLRSQRGDFYRLQESSFQRCFENIPKDFDRMTVAMLLNEVFVKFLPGQNLRNHFRLLTQSLACLDSMACRSEYLFLFNCTLLKLIFIMGCHPKVSHCQKCEVTTAQICFWENFGWNCEKCADGLGFRTDERVLDFVQMVYNTPFRQLIPIGDEKLHQDVFALTEYFFILMGFFQKPLRGLGFLKLSSHWAGVKQEIRYGDVLVDGKSTGLLL